MQRASNIDIAKLQRGPTIERRGAIAISKLMCRKRTSQSPYLASPLPATRPHVDTFRPMRMLLTLLLNGNIDPLLCKIFRVIVPLLKSSTVKSSSKENHINAQVKLPDADCLELTIKKSGASASDFHQHVSKSARCPTM